MAIQDRRGSWENFDPTKMRAGEPATILSGDPNADDGRSFYKAFAPGIVKRMCTYQEVSGLVTQAQTAAENAEIAETNAETAEENAETAVTNAEAKATLSESYAKGGTGTRTGEDTDNAKYYKEQVEQAIETIEPTFVYDPTTGHLSYTDAIVVFSYNQSTGHLSYGIGA